MIHNSHPRKDLIEIISLFEFPIDDYEFITKLQLSKLLWKQLQKKVKIKPDNEFFFVSDITDLKNYLINVSPRQSFPVKIQDEIFEKTRNLIFYCKTCEYSLVSSVYNDIDDVIKDAEFISCFGDNPSVRRAIRLLKEDPKISENEVPVAVITQKMEKRLLRQKEGKKKEKPTTGLQIKHGLFRLTFE